MSSLILDHLDTYGPQRCRQLDYEQAARYTRKLARTHHENFTVASWLLPSRLREDFHHIYAFCRAADDLGDETGDPHRSEELLAWWRSELDNCYADKPRHPVFVALRRTIVKHRIPRDPFDNLIDAFVQDQTVRRYDSWNVLLDYCTRSANPVGRLVLYTCGYRDAQRQQLSDATCTALQLANFWQDVRRDVIDRDRVYIPRDVAEPLGLDIETMVQAVRHDALIQVEDRACHGSRRLSSVDITTLLPAYRATLKQLCDRTWPLFIKGRQLWPITRSDVRVDVALFTEGGQAILRMIRQLDYNTLERRPRLGRGRKIALLMRAVAGRFLRIGGQANGCVPNNHG